MGVCGVFTLNSGGALAWEPGNRGQTKGGGERMRGDPFVGMRHRPRSPLEMQKMLS